MYSEKISDATQWNAVTNKIVSSFHSVVTYNVGQLNYSNDNLKISLFGRNRDWQFNTTTHQQGKNYGLDIQNKWSFAKYSLLAGAYYENEEAENLNNNVWYKNKRNNAAAFARVETDLSKQTKLYIGGREAYIENAGSEFCPQLQILHKLNQNESIYANINKSFRAPTLSEQYGFSATQLINPDLRPESGWSYEMGWKKQISAGRLLKLDVYHMQIHDRIYAAKQNGLTIYQNAPGYKNTGVEISYDQKLNNRYSWGLAASYSDPMQQSSTSSAWARTDYRLGITANLGYSIKNVSANLFATYMGVRADDVAPLLSINLNVRYKMTDRDSIYLKINNLLNREDLRTATGSLLEQRSWLLSYERSF
jgi:iron complex outermembrane receptor protein